jgi:hypothetical protein
MAVQDIYDHRRMAININSLWRKISKAQIFIFWESSGADIAALQILIYSSH